MKQPFFTVFRGLSSFVAANAGKHKPLVFLHYSCVMESLPALMQLETLKGTCSFVMTADSFCAAELLREHSTIPRLRKAAAFLTEKLAEVPDQKLFLSDFYRTPDFAALAHTDSNTPLIFVFFNAGACEEFACSVNAKASDRCYLLYFNPRCTGTPNAIDVMYPFAVKLSLFAKTKTPAAYRFRSAPKTDTFKQETEIPGAKKDKEKRFAETLLPQGAISNRAPMPISVHQSFLAGDVLNEIGDPGSEAEVYKVKSGNPNRIVKIYKTNLSKEAAEIKIQYLSDLAQYEGFFGGRVIMPVSLIYNAVTQNLAGFTMREAPGNQLARRHLFVDIRKDYPDLIRHILLLLLELRLFDMDMLDLSGGNLLVTDEGDVFLIDADSIQTPYFTSDKGPELGFHPDIDTNTSEQWFRLQSHIDFSLSILLFQCVMHGVHPLCSTEEVACWKKQSDFFPYGMTDVSRVNKTFGKMWLNLSEGLRKAFFETFTFRRELSLEAWINVFQTEGIIRI